MPDDLDFRHRLARVLALTASSVDGEALSAARTANKLLGQAGLTWGHVLTLSPGPPSEPTDPAAIRAELVRREGYVFDPRGKAPPVRCPGLTWRDVLVETLARRLGSPAQQTYLMNLLRRAGGIAQDWRPTWIEARTIIAARRGSLR